MDKKQRGNSNNVSKQTASVVPIGIIFLIVLVFIGLGIFALSMYTIDTGYRGVLKTWGKPNMVVIEEGLHFKWPIAQTIEKMHVRTLKIERPASAASSDLQEVSTTVTVNYHLNPIKVPRIYQQLGYGYEGVLIEPTIQESVKAATAQYTADELIEKRPEVRIRIETLIKEKVEPFHIFIDMVHITDFKFSPEYQKSIEDKEVQRQKALQAKRELERIKTEKEQTITQAEAKAASIDAVAKAEANAIHLKGKALRENPDIIQLEWVNRWTGVMPTTMLGANSPILLGMPLQNNPQEEETIKLG